MRRPSVRAIVLLTPLLLVAGCAVGGYDGGGGLELGEGYYEGGADYGGWGESYAVGPYREGFGRGFYGRPGLAGDRGFHGGHQGSGGGRGFPGIPGAGHAGGFGGGHAGGSGAGGHGGGGHR